MGKKWEKFRERLPAFEQPPEFQEKVDRQKAKYVNSFATPADVGRAFVRLRRQKDKLKEKLALLNVELTALEQMLVEEMTGDEVGKFELRNGVSLGLRDDIYSSVTDRDALYHYIKAHRMVQLLSVHYQTLNKLNKEALAAGKNVLPGTSAFLKTSVACRGLKGENGDGDHGASV